MVSFCYFYAKSIEAVILGRVSVSRIQTRVETTNHSLTFTVKLRAPWLKSTPRPAAKNGREYASQSRHLPLVFQGEFGIVSSLPVPESASATSAE